MEISEEDLARIQEKIDKLKNSKFKQQMLPAWRPVPSFGSTMIIFGVFGIIFLSLGIVLYVMSEGIQGITQEYSQDTTCAIGNKECSVPITIEEDITGPVYVYYQLDNFYQNHRRYVKSRSNKQLMGENMAVADLDDCDPIIKNKDLNSDSTITAKLSIGGNVLDEEAAAFPCGLVAKSFFTDKFTSFASADGLTTYAIDSTQIAWESDVEYKFKNLEPKADADKLQWMDVEDPHFIVWMRTAGLPNFRKLYGKIVQDLPKGDYTLTIDNTYDVSSFDGSKYFVLSTTNVFGGTNYFLAVCYIVVGALCIMFGIIFFIAYMGRRSNPGQPAAQ